MKFIFMFLICFAFSQNQKAIFFDSNQHLFKYKSFINFKTPDDIKHKKSFFLNQNLSHWFYAMGPYNDIWCEDIFKVDNMPINRSFVYYPLDNFVLSFQSNFKNNNINKNRSVYINILGFNIKKLNIEIHKDQFYGSE